MRYSLLAGGKRISPVLTLATARALDHDPARAAADGGGDRADPHLLADPRRPARRWTTTSCGAAGRHATSRTARTSRSWPATACSPRPTGCPRATGGRARRSCWRRCASSRDAISVGGMVGGQYIDVAGRGPRRRRPASHARAEDGQADRGQRRGRAAPAGLVRTAAARRCARSPRSSACCSRSSTTSST